LVEDFILYVYQVDLQLAPGKGLEKWGELISNKKSSIYKEPENVYKLSEALEFNKLDDSFGKKFIL